MHIKAYPCIERGGIVWTYMGPTDRQPAPPEVEWSTLPAERVFVSKRLQYSNWLQAMEGGIDTAHVSYVHRYEVDGDPKHQGVKAQDYIKADANGEFEIEKQPATTPWAGMCGCPSTTKTAGPGASTGAPTAHWRPTSWPP